MSTPVAQVYDLRSTNDLRRMKERQERAAEQAGAGLLDDLADAVEVIHQLANLAGFSERPRALIFALATAAHTQGQAYVELFDPELAELQNCSTKTVQRQRADYLLESHKLNFDLVEIVEGEFDREENRHRPTCYRFHIGEVVVQVVTEARVPGLGRTPAQAPAGRAEARRRARL